MPSFRRTSAGTEICPCAVTLEWAIATLIHYHGNLEPATVSHGYSIRSAVTESTDATRRAGM
jgi:hypothetical protein